MKEPFAREATGPEQAEAGPGERQEAAESVRRAGTAVPPPASPAPPETWRQRLTPTRTGTLLGFSLTAALLLYWVPAARLGETDLDRMGGLGLISVLPAPALAGAGLLVVVFAALLRPGREHRTLLLVTLLATVVSLHALPAVIETEPRFATAWQHLGFLDHIHLTARPCPTWTRAGAGRASSRRPRSSPRPAGSPTSPR
ncbi:hypothetical protein SGLAM104S_05691 [Streptomyces glaucescens]